MRRILDVSLTLSLAFAAGCGDDGPAAPPDASTARPDEVPASWVQLTAAGLSGDAALATGSGSLSALRVEVPAGLLAEDEVAYLNVELAAPTDEDRSESPADPVEALGWITIEVYPSALASRVLDGSEIRVTVDVDGVDVPAALRVEARAAPSTWAASQLVMGGSTRDDDTLTLSSNGSCSRARRRRAYSFRTVHGLEVNDSSAVVGDIELAIRGLPPGALYSQVTRVPNSTGTRQLLYWVLEPTVSFRATGGRALPDHFGHVDFRYFPVSASGVAPTPFPADQSQVQACFGQIFEVAAAVLKDHGFVPIAGEHDGEAIGIDVFFYDYALSSNVGAKANMRYRAIHLPTSMLEIPAAGCLDGLEARAEHRHAFGSILHEVFHLQQAASVADLDGSYGALIDDLQRWIDVPTPVNDLGTGRVEIEDYAANKWLTESTARYFEHTVVPPLDPSDVKVSDYPLVALAGYPITGPAFDVVGGRFYEASSWYHYGRFFFLKFLMDQETPTRLAEPRSQGHELRLLADLWMNIGAAARAEVTVENPKRYAALAQAWARDRLDLGWFDFFREHALLRGCAADSSCDCSGVPDTHPFSRGTQRMDAYWDTPSFDDSFFWQGFAAAGCFERLPDAGGLPHYASYSHSDAGRTVSRAASCFVDTNEAIHYLHEPAGDTPTVAASALHKSGALPGLTFLPLPRQAQAPLSGVRIDIVDDLVWSTVSEYEWRFSFGNEAQCPDTMRYEVYQLDGGALERLKAGTVAAERTFTLAQEGLDPSSERMLVVLVGNDTDWDADWDTALPTPSDELCSLGVSVTLKEFEGRASCGYCSELYPARLEFYDPPRDGIFCNFRNTGTLIDICNLVDGATFHAQMAQESLRCCFENARPLISEYCGIDALEDLVAPYQEQCEMGFGGYCACTPSPPPGPVCFGCSEYRDMDF